MSIVSDQKIANLRSDPKRIEQRFYVKLVVFSVLICVGVVTSISAKTLLGQLMGMTLTGLMIAHAVELQHQCLHGTAFRSARMNRIVGILLGLPMLVSFTHYQVRHLAHHRNLGTSKDQEFFDNPYLRMHQLSRFKRLGYLFVSLFNFERYARLAQNVQRALTRQPIEGELRQQQNARIQGEYAQIATVIVLAVLLSVVFQTPILICAWLIPLVFVAEPAHSLMELPEHEGCNKQHVSPLLNTRTIKGNWFSFWFTNGNNFHVEHHLLPSVAIDDLPAFHGTFQDKIANLNRSYPEFFIQYFYKILYDRAQLRASAPPEVNS